MTKQFVPRIRLNPEEYKLILNRRASGSGISINKPQELQQRILFFDIETAPSKGYIWDWWKDNLNQSKLITDWFMLCYAAKWQGEDNVITDALPFYNGYDDRSEDDHHIILSLWKLLDQADIVIAHNGQKFDIKKFNARCAYYNMRPPSPYRVVDTLKLAKGMFSFSSNRLDYLGEHLGLGRKKETGGFELWKACLEGDPEAWLKMVEYCAGDVVLLEQVYLRLRAWDKKAPSVAPFFKDNELRCTVCGSTDLTQGHPVYTNKSSFDSYQCNSCGHWSKLSINNFSKHKRESLMINVL